MEIERFYGGFKKLVNVDILKLYIIKWGINKG